MKKIDNQLNLTARSYHKILKGARTLADMDGSENILDAHELVQMSCVIGVPDPLRMQKVKAFVMLKPGLSPREEYREILLAYCRKNIAKYAMPREIEFRDQLPKTLVGKVAYRQLEEEELAKMKAQETAQAKKEQAK